ncbi:MAG: hypothetical protein JXA18_00595 [Chitinispirillaceae bacterium]|nr:hypothetical protein [Chitinispirillaceae bacterium]
MTDTALHSPLQRSTLAVAALFAILTVASAQTTADGGNESPPVESASPVENNTITDSLPAEVRVFPVDTMSDTSITAGLDSSIIDTSTDSAAIAVPVDTIRTLQTSRRRKRGAPAFSPPESLYTGISPEQDFLARTYVSQIFAFSWDEAARTAKKLQRLERKDKLPPLSMLLMVASRAIRFLNGEFENDNKQRQTLREIEELKTKFLRQLDDKSLPDSLLPITLFLEGGVRGLCAVIKIETNVVEAAIDGFAALNRLEKLLEILPGFNDAFLGLGIFYCALARAPGIVRASLNLVGRQVSFEGGLDFLRRCAYRGRYTAEIASLYLVRFLSPYWGHLTEEKDRILNGLRKQYPGNPYYVFLATDEDICFHPERLDRAYARRLETFIRSWKARNYSLQRYDNLARHQLRFIAGDTGSVSPATENMSPCLPDTSFDLREFSFYPQFLDALRERRHFRQDGLGPPVRARDQLTKKESAALRALGLSNMSDARRNLYEWHIRDALKLQ